MMYIATVTAYDALTNVVVHARVTEYGDVPEETPSTVLACTTTVLGTGESSPREWLQDALVAMLEAI
jgi:hypothetical protein